MTSRRPGLYRTPATQAIARVLVAEPHALHWNTELCGKTGLRSSTVVAVLGKLLTAGLIADAGMQRSDLGGSPRHVYRVVDVVGLRRLLDPC